MNKKEEDVFYIGVKDPSSVRKTMLESSRSIVESLQRYEKFKIIREQKEAEILRFKEDIREVNKTITKLRVLLPKTKLKEALPKKEKKVKAKKIEKKLIPKLETRKEIKPSELQKLEGELADIESKLARLG